MNVSIPSHTLYIDDIMLFTKVCSFSLDAIAELFIKYDDYLGQICNPSKSILYAGSMSVARHGFWLARYDSRWGFFLFSI